jgi:general stress protein 26
MVQTPANDTSPDPKGDGLAFIWKNIQQLSDCMLVTRDNTSLRSRPMRGIARQDDNAIWFITAKTSHKDDEIARDPQACLCYSDKSSNTYVSLSGAVDMTDDPEQIHALWNAGAQAYFNAGPDDPNIILLKFTPDFGEYWDSPSNPVLLAIQFIKSKVTGEKPKLGENKKVAMA